MRKPKPYTLAIALSAGIVAAVIVMNKVSCLTIPAYFLVFGIVVFLADFFFRPHQL